MFLARIQSVTIVLWQWAPGDVGIDDLVQLSRGTTLRHQNVALVLSSILRLAYRRGRKKLNLDGAGVSLWKA